MVFIHPDSRTIREELQRFAHAQETAAEDKFQAKLRNGLTFQNIQNIKASSSVVHFNLSQYVAEVLRMFEYDEQKKRINRIVREEEE